MYNDQLLYNVVIWAFLWKEKVALTSHSTPATSTDMQTL